MFCHFYSFQAGQRMRDATRAQAVHAPAPGGARAGAEGGDPKAAGFGRQEVPQDEERQNRPRHRESDDSSAGGGARPAPSSRRSDG